ncbi:MAG TPA: hypothetical protein VGP50_00825, partial [Stellaceae bacterium]|nr:hypothetical protein [Stellaceae bacterium]
MIREQHAQADTVELGVGDQVASRYPPLAALMGRNALEPQAKVARDDLTRQTALDAQASQTP